MENSVEKYFYIQKFKYTENENIDISSIPMMVRRKLSIVDKYAIFTLLPFRSYSIDEIIYSSRYGEIERLFKLIEQYCKNNEVSPILFSSSVHNYLVGLFSQLNNLTSSYTSISAGDKSFSMGLLKSVLTNKNSLLYCYVDKINEKVNAISFLVSKNTGDIKCKLTKKDNTNLTKKNEFEDFIKFLNNEISRIDFDCYSIERVD